MAKTKTQDGKIILVVGIVAAIVLITWAVIGLLSLKSKFNTTTSDAKDLSEVAGVADIDAAAKLLNNPPMWKSTKIKGGRPLELLTPLPLFLIPGDPHLIDLFNEKGKPVHPPIPNKWWLTHKIDPSFKNSLKRDSDGDGFSNIEEFKAKTSPSDKKDYPSLVDKLRVADSSLIKWQITFSSDIGEDQYQFRYADGAKNSLRSEYIGRGAKFFAKGPVEGRFVLKDVLEKEVEKNGMVQKVKYAVIEDTMKSKTLEIKRGRTNDIIGKDYTVSFVLKALGQDSKVIKLKENSRFDLPEGKVSPEGNYHFVGVNDAGLAVINYLMGEEEKTLTLPVE